MSWRRLTVLTILVAGLAVAAPVRATAALPVRVMSWNVCGNVVSPPAGTCLNTRSTTAIANGIWQQMAANGMTTGTSVKVLLLQETCYADVERMRSLSEFSGWSFGFIGILDGSTKRDCHPDRSTGAARGQFGIVVGVNRSATFTRYHYNAYPEGDNGYGDTDTRQGLVCATVSAVSLTTCSTHLTPTPTGTALAETGHPTSYFRNIELEQAKGIPYRIGTSGRLIAGGDLNAEPPDSTDGKAISPNPIVPLYNAYHECDQTRYGARDGHGTFQYQDGRLGKLDYVFATRSAVSSCTVTDQTVTASDHRPVAATITFA